MSNARTIIATLAAVLLAGCFKDVSYKTDYVLKPLVQELSVDPSLPFEGLKAFAFAADTAFYTVASYEDALGGVISLRDNPSQKISTPSATAEPFESEASRGWIHMPLSGPSRMIVAVDPVHRLYAFTQQEVTFNLPNLYVSLVFKPWKEGFSYKDGDWVFRNDFYVPPTYLDCYIDPSAQLVEGGATTRIASLKAYAYAADTTAWYIASYDDALAGKITSKDDDSFTRTNPNFQAFEEKDTGLYKMSVSNEMLMVVVVDREHRRYAYTKQLVDLEGSPVTFPAVVFRLWNEVWIDSVQTGGWVIVDPALDPENPGTQTQNRRR